MYIRLTIFRTQVSESSSDCKGYSTCTVDDGANLCGHPGGKFP